MREVAIVSYSQAPMRRDAGALTEVEMLMPVIDEALRDAGLERGDIDFICSGSCDYLPGSPFSFVMALDALGAVPCAQESHVEMDAAWALYEAWLKFQCGEIDTALIYGFGKSSPGALPDVLTLQLDPYYTQPLWPDSISLAALQAQLALHRGVISEEEMAEVVIASRAAGLHNPCAQLKGEVSLEALLAAPMLVSPLRRHDCAPISDGGVAVVLAAGDRARELCDRPAWIRGIDHRADGHHLNLRDLTEAPSAAIAAEKAGVADGPVDVAELHACFTHQEPILRTALGLGDDVEVNPSGGPLAANPMMAAGLIRLVEVANRIHAGEVGRGVAHATGGHALQHNLVAVLEGDK
jgi:acetyl-CoA acetyltransferase